MLVCHVYLKLLSSVSTAVHFEPQDKAVATVLLRDITCHMNFQILDQ